MQDGILNSTTEAKLTDNATQPTAAYSEGKQLRPSS